MKLWILLLVAGVLLVIALWSERFEPTPSIRAPPYDAAEKKRIFNMANPTEQATLRAMVANPTAADAAEKAGELLTPAVGDFFTQVFRPATAPITAGQVDAFVDGRPASSIKDIEKRVLKIYFVDQQGIGTSQASGYADILAGMGQGPGYLMQSTGATGPSGSPTGPTGAAGAAGAATGPTGAATGPTGAATGPTGGTTTTGGTTASGTTTTTPGVSNGLFGPAFTSFGDPSPNGNTQDSSKFTSYPQVLGGRGEPVTTLAGAGVVGRGFLGELPSLDSLGASEKSQYFPFSRTPGDLERIPDPFRVAQTFDLSSLSSKTEPVPFLTDFSAFQR